MALLVVYSSDNLIVSHLLGPEEVTKYNVVYRYFSIVTIAFSVVMAPFWSAITDAYIKNEMNWIRKKMLSLFYILIGGFFLALFLALISKWVFAFWINDNFVVSSLFVALMALYVVSMAWLNMFSFFSNGIGKIRMQMLVYITAAVLNLPLSYYFAKTLDMGISGVLVATIICVNLINIILTIQYFKIVNGTAKGIWNK